ncbi:MAG: VIT domain-containing protein [Myxococcota bacterium]
MRTPALPRCGCAVLVGALACAPAGPDDTTLTLPAPTISPAAADTHDSALRWVRTNTCEDGSPLSLTAADGTGLRLASLRARGVVQGPLALTQLRLRFDNPEARQREGRFAITLPPGAAISRFAMKTSGGWQEGEVVERGKARRTYEDFLHRRQDPALLEHDAGNVFRARVFPIAPSATTELIVTYSDRLAAGEETYRLMLCGLPELQELDVGVAIGPHHLTHVDRDVTPTADLEAWVGDAMPNAVRHGDRVVARIEPVLDVPTEPLTELTVLVDTSASRAMDFSGQLERLDALVRALAAANPGLRLKVGAFDQTLVPIFEGAATAFSVEPLVERGAMGASDLGRALTELETSGLASPRLLLATDGIATAGELDETTVAETLRSAGVTRVDAWVDGSLQDANALRRLTRAGADHGIVADARTELVESARRMGLGTVSDLEVEVPGARWVWPQTIDAVQPGDEVLVYAEVSGPFKVGLVGASVVDLSPVAVSVAGPLIARAHAEARIEAWQDELATADTNSRGRAALVQKIVDTSVRQRVLSQFTAMLVLETDADYRRYDIDRTALTAVLTVGPKGVEVLERKPLSPRRIVAVEADEWTASGVVPVSGAITDEPVKGFIESVEAEESGYEAEFGGYSGGVVTPRLAQPRLTDSVGPIVDAGELRGRPESVADGVTRFDLLDSDGALDGPPGDPPARGRMSFGPPPPQTQAASGRPKSPNAWEGRFDTIMKRLAAGDVAAAHRAAEDWRTDSPGDVLAWLALGASLEASGEPKAAARAYGSLIDLFPSRADLRRTAGQWLMKLEGDGHALAIDTFGKAAAQRPDHPTGVRQLAYALAQRGDLERAFNTLNDGLDREYPRRPAASAILAEDLALLGHAWIAAAPEAAKTVLPVLAARSLSRPEHASTRLVLCWETDANDVDLHIFDAKGGHAYYEAQRLASGGSLSADVTQGYGPERFEIEGTPTAGPYRVQAHYYRRGPMGYGMGALQVVHHDGAGKLTVQDHPFVVMRDGAWVDLTTVD